MQEIKTLIKKYEFLDSVSKIYGFNEELKKFLIPRVEILKNVDRKEQEFNILAFGDYNSGKSTIINRVLGEEILPHLAGINNLVPIKIKLGKNNKTIFRVMKNNDVQKAQSRNLGDIISQDYNSQLGVQKGIDHYLLEKASKALEIDKKKNVNLIALNSTGDSNSTRDIEYVAKANKILFVIDASKYNLAKVDSLLNFVQGLRLDLFKEAVIILNKIDIAQRIEIDEIKQYILKNFDVKEHNILEMSLNNQVGDLLRNSLQTLINNSADISMKQMVNMRSRFDDELNVKVTECIDNANLELRNLQLPITKEIERYSICLEQINEISAFELKEKALKTIILNHIKKDFNYEIEEFKSSVKYDTDWHSYDEDITDENETIPGVYRKEIDKEVQGVYKNFLTKINLSKDNYMEWFSSYINQKTDEYISNTNKQIEKYYLDYNIITDEKLVRNVANNEVCHVDLELDSKFETDIEIKFKSELETEGVRSKNTKMSNFYKLANMSNFNIQTREEFLDVLYDLADRIYDAIYNSYGVKIINSLKEQKEVKVNKVNSIIDLKKASIKTIAGVPKLVEQIHRLEAISTGEFEQINLENELSKFSRNEPINLNMNMNSNQQTQRHAPIMEAVQKEEPVRRETQAARAMRKEEPKVQEAPRQVEKPKKKKGCTGIFIIIILLICLGGGVFYFTTKMLSKKDSDTTPNITENQNNKPVEETNNNSTNTENTNNDNKNSSNTESSSTNEQTQQEKIGLALLGEYKTVTGVINGNTNVSMTLDGFDETKAFLAGTEIYPSYPNQSYDLTFYDDGDNKFTAEEVYQGSPTGEYKLTLVGSYLNGTFENLSTGKVSNVILRLEK